MSQDMASLRLVPNYKDKTGVILEKKCVIDEPIITKDGFALRLTLS